VAGGVDRLAAGVLRLVYYRGAANLCMKLIVCRLVKACLRTIAIRNNWRTKNSPAPMQYVKEGPAAFTALQVSEGLPL